MSENQSIRAGWRALSILPAGKDLTVVSGEVAMSIRIEAVPKFVVVQYIATPRKKDGQLYWKRGETLFSSFSPVEAMQFAANTGHKVARGIVYAERAWTEEARVIEQMRKVSE